ncbi:MAG: hypothetical protein HY337_05480 [Gemmatimonadetes bacterium]|nr:hypothetical protein [Gemmatimonadota bacterium]
MSHRLRRFLSDWPIKLTALVLAVLVWAMVQAQEPTTLMVPVTLMIEPPGGAEIVEPLPRVRALYSGAGREIFKLLGSPPRITRIIPDTVAGPTVTLDLSTADLVILTDAEVAAREVEPRRIQIRFRRPGTPDDSTNP